MFLSIFDIFKIGVGPSSSHTMGPMVAAARFLASLRASDFTAHGLRCSLHGSLAFTGKGHATDRAVILGLAGFQAETFDMEAAEAVLAQIYSTQRVELDGLAPLAFHPARDLVFDYERALPGHSNGMILCAVDMAGDVILQETYYSIGGGFVLTEAELGQDMTAPSWRANVPHPFHTATQMIEMAETSGKSISQMKWENELSANSHPELSNGIAGVWEVMTACIDRGLDEGGILPGGLKLRRRAKAIMAQLLEERGQNLTAPHTINDWISVYAMAVNEVNAAGGQVVTAPTNGAAGVIPATIRYYLDHVPTAQPSKVADFLLVAAAVGGLIKQNASISGAEVGCQGEVGSASAMAAAGLCEVLGGTPKQVENAAEIALEHHLGMTCDPIKGLVQAPCIERNGLGAIKAVSAASLALRGDGDHLVSLDACVETMRQTGLDMSNRYKETSLGGLAVNVANC
ncbi:MAG: L-serine ammonia-lyase [Alphaproteobacteria bacterium]|nr:L-serine ammonia-lyase [Alphaproteobacteria bacterium]